MTSHGCLLASIAAPDPTVKTKRWEATLLAALRNIVALMKNVAGYWAGSAAHPAAWPGGDGRPPPTNGRTPPELVVTDNADPAVRAAIAEGLARSNRAHVGDPNMRPLVVTVRDPASGELHGGLWGRTAWSWLFIELVFVAEQARGAGWGRRLIRAAEAEALQRNCHSAWVDTYSFQARGFYERLGYGLFGALDDYPAGHQRFFLCKRLSDDAERADTGVLARSAR
jgi:GNAT superfamily N-acetyltransferase